MKKIKIMTAMLLMLVLILGSCGPAAGSASTEASGTGEQTAAAEAATSEESSEEDSEEASSEEDLAEEETEEAEKTQTEEDQEKVSENAEEADFEETGDGVILDDLITGDMASSEVSEQFDESGQIKEVNEEELNRARSTLLYNNAALFYYYTKLNKGQKKMYRRLLNVLRYPDSHEPGKAFKLKVKPYSEKYRKWNSKVYMALEMDHPELFWYFRGDNDIAVWRTSSRYPDENGRYTYQYYLEGTYKNYKKEVTAFYDAVDKIMKGLDKNAPKCKLALQVHDRLIDLCDYNHEAYANKGSSSYSRNYCHSAYGALVKDSSGRWNKPVCDGYSLAYEYVLQQLGFYVTVICGDAGSSRSDAEGHAWNAVYLNGNWYEVDSTWDDIDPDSNWNRWEAGRLAAKDSAFIRKVRHYMFLVSTDYISNFTDGAYLRYRLRNGAWYQPRGNSVHIRWNKNSYNLYSEAPYCPGGKYFHGQNI